MAVVAQFLEPCKFIFAENTLARVSHKTSKYPNSLYEMTQFYPPELGYKNKVWLLV